MPIVTCPALLAQESADEPLVSVRLDRDETYADIAPRAGKACGPG